MTQLSLTRSFHFYAATGAMALGCAATPPPPAASQEAANREAIRQLDNLTNSLNALNTALREAGYSSEGKEKEAEQKGALRHADDATFAGTVLARKGLALVDVYADWCGPCQNLKIEDYALRAGPDVMVVKMRLEDSVESVKHLGLADEKGQVSLPGLVLVKDGKPVERIASQADPAETIRNIEAAVVRHQPRPPTATSNKSLSLQ